MRRASLLLTAVLLCGCSGARPKFYPDWRWKMAGGEQAEKDAEACLEQAKKHVKSEWVMPLLKGAAVGAAAAAGIGGLIGVVNRNVGNDTIKGAITGAALGAGRVAFTRVMPDPVQRTYVDRCLEEQGYTVIGWR